MIMGEEGTLMKRRRHTPEQIIRKLLLGTTSRCAVEICAGDRIQCDAANLVINHGWDALLIDGNVDLIARGQWFYSRCRDTVSCPPILHAQWITAENINDVLVEQGFTGEINLLSLDLDGLFNAPLSVAVANHSSTGQYLRPQADVRLVTAVD